MPLKKASKQSGGTAKPAPNLTIDTGDMIAEGPPMVGGKGVQGGVAKLLGKGIKAKAATEPLEIPSSPTFKPGSSLNLTSPNAPSSTSRTAKLLNMNKTMGSTGKSLIDTGACW